MEDISNYQQIKETAEKFYKEIGRLFCPVFNEPVIFNSEGFNHLIYKKGGERAKGDQITKLKLLSLAKEIVRVTTTYQEYDEGLVYTQKKKFKKKVNESTSVKYWGLVAIIKNCRVKVVIRQVGNSQKYFYSVIPAWTIRYYNGIKMISNAKGDLSLD
ncbi:MAG: hypothetical protein NTV62_03030 [Candidatus Gribaldobacteria bacterium]|nr:hypothetical protein [Candidatus Gribaldobacteria bacterium]